MRRPSFLTLAVLALLTAALATNPGHATPSVFKVGVAQRSINPEPDGTFAGKPVYLGGYGFGYGPIADGLGLSRPPADGILGNGVAARAWVVATDDDPAHALVLAQLDTQGYFAAYQQGPWGLEDMRKGVEAEIGIPAERVIIGANHTHGGPDTLGVWGGVPNEYLEYIYDQAIGAIGDAWAARADAQLWYGSVDADDLLANQFSYDPANTLKDREMRVLQARDPGSGNVLGTLVNFSAHPTVMGDDNLKASADWTGPAADLLTGLGGRGLVVVGTLGRSQPSDGASYNACGGDQYCALDHYANRVFQRALDAIAAATPLTDPTVDGHSYLITDVAHNALLLALTSPAGELAGVPIKRATTPPWAAGNVLGTVTFSARIGDVLISGGPGEFYAQIPDAVRTAAGSSIRGMMTVGLAGDQLGYIIAPFPEAYPEPIRRSFFDGNPNDPASWGFSPVDNDNYFFNVSHTLGERLICSLLRGAGAVLNNDDMSLWSTRSKCIAFTNDLLLPPGSDATLS